ncbi:hypothetical protein PJ985_20695 [Streptomyces sp. ACA25]|uniref:hypothetical protein n=1 Tax=Streptomyces sp. ACA25 TaxID=3022596 RepID=UPI002307CC56|nr:hypothetical protein [Streptomyces sp. ACA25]MDB1089981.1 hypothetical protein [Streptomyces sp. ACA25]
MTAAGKRGSHRDERAGHRDAAPVLGVDVGGVIIARVAAGADTSFFGSQPLTTPAVEGVFATLALLTAEPFGQRVHLVSTAGPRVARNTRAWLHHHEFFRRTGIPATHLHFVRKRADKAPVCTGLGITHFIDDHLDVLEHLTTVSHRYLFLGGLGDAPAPAETPPWATVADTWTELAVAIRNSPPVAPDTPAPAP